MYKKCNFAKLGNKKRLKKSTKKSKALTSSERSKELTKWRNGWSKLT